VRQYEYQDDYAPILPRGTILHIIGYMDNTPNNKNIPDPRNWQGSGNRSIANMFIDLGQIMPLTDQEFQEEMAKASREARTESSGRHRRMPAVQRDSAAGHARDDGKAGAAAVNEANCFFRSDRGARLSNGEHPNALLLARPERLTGL
jgi:hypothetical protein